MGKAEKETLVPPGRLKTYIKQTQPNTIFRTEALDAFITIIDDAVDRVAAKAVTIAQEEQTAHVLKRQVNQAAKETLAIEFSAKRIVEILLSLESADLDNVAQTLDNAISHLETEKRGAKVPKDAKVSKKVLLQARKHLDSLVRLQALRTKQPQ